MNRPGQKTIWLFREKLTQEKLTQSGAFKSLFAAFWSSPIKVVHFKKLEIWLFELEGAHYG